MEKIIILGHVNPDVDSIISGYLMEKLLSEKNIKTEFVIPDKEIDNESFTICNTNGLNAKKYQRKLTEKDKKFILVDHHERDVNGEVIAIIDHHPKLTESNELIKHYYNKNSSSTTCLICQENENYFNKHDIYLACIGAMVDTASFNSTKATKKDKDWVKQMCKKHNFDYEELYNIGLCLTDLTDLNNASLNGLKKYSVLNKNIESSYIQIKKILNNQYNINKIIKILQNYIVKENIDIFVFIVHDMETFKSTVWQIEKNNIKIKQYQNYTSRGNTIIPDVINELKNTNN